MAARGAFAGEGISIRSNGSPRSASAASMRATHGA